MRYIYLAGKIATGHTATDYRSKVAPKLFQFGLESLDPLRGKYDIEGWRNLNPNEVVYRDLSDIKRSSVVLAVMMQSRTTSFGTPCEIMYAWERKIPVVIVTDDPDLRSHFWVKCLCSRIFFVDKENFKTFNDVLDDAVSYIGFWYGVETEREVYGKPSIK